MGTFQPTRAPLQLEKLENEELLRYFCETHEELYVLALWKRIADRQLNWMARRFCPHWYNPEWMVLGSLSRAIKRFQKHVCGFTAKLETPSFGAYSLWNPTWFAHSPQPPLFQGDKEVRVSFPRFIPKISNPVVDKQRGMLHHPEQREGPIEYRTQ